MRLLRALGLAREPRTPPLVEKALDTAAISDHAAGRARAAVDSYWRARRAADRANDQLVVDDYDRAERQRTAR